MRNQDEPKNIRDLWWMKKTSHQDQIDYKQIRDTNTKPEVGAIDEKEIDVSIDCYANVVTISETVYIISDVRNEYSYSLSGKSKKIGSYDFEEFKSTEWWGKCLKAWEDGSTDGSWYGDVYSEVEPYEDYAYMEMQVSRQYYDWFMNKRQSKEAHDLSISVDKLSGEIEILYDKETYAFTMDELKDLFRIKELLDEQHIELEDGYVTIRFCGE
jgi:hypothetical protein